MSRLSINKQVRVETSATGVYSEDCIDRNFDMGKKETAVLIFDDNGLVLDCNQAAAKLLDCSARELAGQSISSLFPELEKIILVHGQRAISCLRFLSSIAHRFDVVSKSSEYFASELYFGEVENTGRHQLCVMIINPTMQDSLST
jgi:PAS domain-containing protein